MSVDHCIWNTRCRQRKERQHKGGKNEKDHAESLHGCDDFCGCARFRHGGGAELPGEAGQAHHSISAGREQRHRRAPDRHQTDRAARQGGSNDIVGRLIATKLTERLGKQVVADNRGGAGGVIGTEAAAKSEPDGHTLLIISSAYAFNTWLYKLPYDSVKAFTPVAKLGTGPNVLAVHPSVPASSVKELVALAKREPGKLNFASAGAGSFQHLGTELFKMIAGVDIAIVQFKGGGPAMIDLIGGHTQATLGSLIQFMPHIKSGKVKALGTGGAKRSVVLPDVPTIAEAGVSGYEANNW
ncbi:MAG: hypothetical protein HYU47_11815, partial [Deltaproteobacteria bacterium]|nr:hypothetical protein [Deltaproteobacteria bacterium]